MQRQKYSMVGNSESSGAIEYTKFCHGQFNLLHSRNLAKLKNSQERNRSESLEINSL